MSDRASPLGADFKPGQNGNVASGIGVRLSEPQYGYIGEMAAFAGSESAILKLAGTAAGRPGAISFPIASNNGRASVTPAKVQGSEACTP